MLELFPDEVNIAFKHFPLPRHAHARSATASAMAAGEQGKFWEFHDALFANYQKLNNDNLMEIARDLDLDMDRFAKDRKNPSFQHLINEDIKEGNAVGVRGTPSVYLNGRKLRGVDLNTIAREVRRELKKLDKAENKVPTARILHSK